MAFTFPCALDTTLTFNVYLNSPTVACSSGKLNSAAYETLNVLTYTNLFSLSEGMLRVTNSSSPVSFQGTKWPDSQNWNLNFVAGSSVFENKLSLSRRFWFPLDRIKAMPSTKDFCKDEIQLYHVKFQKHGRPPVMASLSFCRLLNAGGSTDGELL